MANDLTISGSHPLGERSAALAAHIEEALAVDSVAGKIEVRWAPDEAVTPPGQPPFFVDCLKGANLFDPFVAEAPLVYAGPNKPQVLGDRGAVREKRMQTGAGSQGPATAP